MPGNIMLDLETLGATPGCSILAIGAVACHDDGFISDTFYIVVSRSSCAEYGLFEETGTLEWWSRQSEEARKVLILADDPTAASVPDALNALNTFVRRQGRNPLVWGNGSDFDNAILAAAAGATYIDLAWPFYNNACYRTLKRRAPNVPIRRTGTHHNALDDARSQAEHLGRINRALTLDSATITAANIFLGHMADHYRARSARRFFGLQIPTMCRQQALEHARATFDAMPLDEPFGCPGMSWDRGGAQDLVDADLEHWEA